MNDEIEREARSLQAEDRKSVELAAEGDHSLFSPSIEDLETREEAIESQEPGFYALPFHARQILGRKSFAALEQILGEIKELNDQLAGMPVIHASILLGGDEQILDIKRRLREWVAGYVEARVRRRNDRDGGCPLRKFQRIYKELMPDLQQIGYQQRTAHMTIMGEAPRCA